MRNFTLNFVKNTLFLVAISIIVCSCITGREEFRDLENFKVEKKNSLKTQVSMVSIYEDNGNTVIYGHVKRNGQFAIAGGGHVDIVIRDLSGRVVAQSSTKYSPSRITVGHSSRFKEKFSLEGIKEGTVLITHHPTRSTSSCQGTTF